MNPFKKRSIGLKSAGSQRKKKNEANLENVRLGGSRM
jgi:hypothetical protein